MYKDNEGRTPVDMANEIRTNQMKVEIVKLLVSMSFDVCRRIKQA